MEHPRLEDLMRRTIAAARAGEPVYAGEDGTVPASDYTDPARCAAETARVFGRLPIPLVCSAELDGPGATVVRELAGVSLLVVRGAGGEVKALRNACRHRATRLLREDCRAKAFVCPYHGWTYGLDGALRHVPRAVAFPGLDPSRYGLVEARAEERHGFVWIALDESAPSAESHLGPIDEELATLGFADHAVLRRVTREQRGNWKVLMEAFLEGYHLRALHRDSIYPFFLDACSLAEQAGPHVRHASARRAALEKNEGASLRDLATFGYSIFPASVLIAHPDWTSHVVVQPLGPDRFSWSHAQLVPSAPSTESAKQHFARSFELIEGSVFQREDLFAVAEIQAGLAAGANDRLTFGRLESAALWFHRALADALGSARS